MRSSFAKILVFITAGMLLLAACLGVFLYIKKDFIIAGFVAEANRHLATEVKVGKIETDLFSKFPRISLRFHQVSIGSSIAGDTAAMCRAEHVYITFGLRELLENKLKAEHLYLENTKIWLKTDSKGRVNYNVIKENPEASENPGGVSFDFELLELKNVTFNYSDERSTHFLSFYTPKARAQAHIKPNRTEAALTGTVSVNAFLINGVDYPAGHNVELNTGIAYLHESRLLKIESGGISLGKSRFSVIGFYDHRKSFVSLEMAGIDTDPGTLIAFLPESTAQKFKVYDSKGNLSFKGRVVGNTNGNLRPLTDFEIVCANGSFHHPDVEEVIKNLSFKATFKSGGKLQDEIKLEDLKGEFAGRPFQGFFQVRNFKNPRVKTSFNASVDASVLFKLFRVPGIASASGLISAQIAFEGSTEELKKQVLEKSITTSGEVILDNLSLDFEKPQAFPVNVSGSFLFNNNDVAVNKISGNLMQTDFVFDGMLINLIPYLFSPPSPLYLKANLVSNFIDGDRLYALLAAPAPNADTARYDSSGVAPASTMGEINFDFRAVINRFVYRRLSATNVSGMIAKQNNAITFTEVKSNFAGGQMNASGRVSAVRNGNRRVELISTVSNMKIDSLFYVFENFGQSFITDKNLDGRLSNTTVASFLINELLQPQTNTLFANSEIELLDGRLKKFEPMLKLSKFVDASELSDIKFKDIKNSIHIENQVIMIPEMVIRSNLNTVSVTGTHTFDNNFDYKLKVELSNYNRKHSGEDAASVETDMNGRTKVYLKMTGNADDFKIAYDSREVKDKLKNTIKEKLQEEKQHLKEIFKNQDPTIKQNPQHAVPEDDEYIDFGS